MLDAMFDALAEFHFLRPWWLLLLFVALLLIWAQIRFVARANNWHKVISDSLFDALIESKSSRRVRLAMALPPLALVCAAFALAGPTYERLPQPVETKQDPLVIVLDLTLSMGSTDIQPSRIERAKFKVSDILEHRDEGLTGLVVYAGDAYVVTPLTSDTSNILNLLPSLHPEMMPVRGSNVVAAVERANELFGSLDQERGRIILLTDGISNFGTLRDTVDVRYPLSILGIEPTEDLAPNGGEAVGGQRLLRDFAMVTGGRYRSITLNDDDIKFLLQKSALSETELLENQTFDTWHDIGYLLVLPLALLLALSMRRGGLAVVLLVVCTNVDAGWLEDLWVPKDRQALAAHDEGNFGAAAELFRDPQWRAVAKYRSGSYAEAEELFSHNESLASIYNRGNALAWEGRFSDAIQAYDSVLSQEPDHEDARHNKAVIEALLEAMQQRQNDNSDESQEGEPQESEQQSNQNAQSQNQSQSDQANSDEDSNQQSTSTQQDEVADANQEESEQSQSDEGNEENEPTERTEAQRQDQSMADEGSDDQSSADLAESSEERELREIHERWLRRIPDDPSGLLQRKFQAESNARIERGELNQDNVGSAW
ncbi:MAG: VWA domain-containing protein [Gammaproteobacteria bacterium]|nr:VWA domain-containing protein [Gammaproteobacteria bacterium]